VQLYINRSSLPFLQGASVDYERQLMHEKFVILSNPQAVGSCGCKNSFDLKAAKAT
jgi:iron-sulfur cluster assembly 2